MTDFGDSDSYVGIMKGVILGIAPETKVIDITHHVSSFHIASASYLLWTYHDRFPPGTVHCVVVDPGVGGERAAMAVKFANRFFVLPDNGLMGMTLAGHDSEFEARKIENDEFMLHPVSDTFHGRDIFAPTAAALASGASFDTVGPILDEIDRPASSASESSGNIVTGSIVHIDKFGNYITNIPRDMTDAFSSETIFVQIGGFNIIGMSRTFSDGKTGDLAAYTGSGGLLEICMVKGSASETIGVPIGSEVVVKGRVATER
ncbi:S-adenosyl-l-methionine hydroxide adenosyltransferase family protein [bacterium]